MATQMPSIDIAETGKPPELEEHVATLEQVAKEDIGQVRDEMPGLEAMHQTDDAVELPPVDQEKFTEEQENKGNDKKRNLLVNLIVDPGHRNTLISGLNALFHGMATVTSFMKTKEDSFINEIYKFSDKTAFLFTRWVAPLSSYFLAALESLKNKKLVEAVIKLVPPVFLPIIGAANIDTVYGSSTGFNCPYDMAVKRVKQKAQESRESAVNYLEANKTFAGNAKMVFVELKETLKDFWNGKLDFEDSSLTFACSCILVGALPILAFARNARDTWFARILGLLRNFGGVLGDAMFFKQGMKTGEFYKQLVGAFCTLAAMSDVVKRWVKSDSIAKILIHLGAALNVAGYAAWNAFSGSQNQVDKDEEAIKKLAVVGAPA